LPCQVLSLGLHEILPHLHDNQIRIIIIIMIIIMMMIIITTTIMIVTTMLKCFSAHDELGICMMIILRL